MKQFIIRLILIVLFYLLFRYAITFENPLLAAFVGCYIIEPLILEKT